MKEILDITKEKMGKCVNALESELATIRAGRANPSVLDRITVDYYGCPTPVNQMASISVSEARILVVQPFDASTLKSIEKAIQASDLGINPTNDGRVLRIAFPQLTEDRRKELCKQVSKICGGKQSCSPQRTPRRSRQAQGKEEEQWDHRGRPQGS